jgi:hypothetical protein
LAAPSEAFTWLHNWPFERTCSFCGKELRVSDVGETRQYIRYERGRGKVSRRYIWCREHRGRTD